MDQKQTAPLVQQQHQIVQQITSGPLPDPETLKRYADIQSDYPERIIKMAEMQAGHRQELEKVSIFSDIKNSKVGILFGFIIGLVGIIGGVVLGLNNKEISGSVIGGTSLVSLVSVFIYGTKSRKAEREKKRKENSG